MDVLAVKFKTENMESASTQQKINENSNKPTYAELKKLLEKNEQKLTREQHFFNQKIMLLEMQVREAKEREESIERLHNTMLKALKDNESTNKQTNFVKEYEYLSEVHRKEMSDAVKSYEMQINHLKDKNSELSDKTESLSISCDSMQKEIKRLVTENNKLEKQLIVFQKDQQSDERLKEEINNIKKNQSIIDTETRFKLEMEKSHELYKQKESQWKELLGKAQSEIDRLKYESQKEKGFNTNSVISFEKQIAELNKELEIVKNENFELKEFKEMTTKAPIQYMNLTEDESDIITLIKQNEDLERQLDERETIICELEANFKKMLNKEKQKSISSKEQLNGYRDKFDLKKNELMHEILEKDEQILKLTKELRSYKLDNRSSSITKTEPLTKNASTPNRDHSEICNNRICEFDNLSKTEYKLLRICQTMIDSASKMECSKCGEMFIPTNFYEHITSEGMCIGSTTKDFTMCLDDEVSTIGHAEKYNFISNKSSRIDLGCPIPRPKSAHRQDFQFGRTQKCNSFLHQSLNQMPVLYNHANNLSITSQNPLMMNCNRQLCQSSCAYSVIPQCGYICNNGFAVNCVPVDQIYTSPMMRNSYQDDAILAPQINEKVAKKLESAENMLIEMNKKVDILRKEKKTASKEINKLAKRLSSVSASREKPLTARNFNQKSHLKQFIENKETTESKVNLVLSDTKSNCSEEQETYSKQK